ncbi:MAG: MBL fold metallo-hydrolase [Syntrophobacteraceae bacterium]
MKWTILGSGGCMGIPKPLCRCAVCMEAREKGIPYARGGPSAFLHDISLLIDTPAEISDRLNRFRINRIDHLMFTHLDPDHIEGWRVVEQITLDFRTWRAYPEKLICLCLPLELKERISNIRSQYGPVLDFYHASGFLRVEYFRNDLQVGDIHITAIPIDRGSQISFVYVFEQKGRKVIYAPCDIKPFPEDRDEVRGADLLIIQPGIFEEGLPNGFSYPADHISRTTLYTFGQTLELAKRIDAKEVLFVHIEEYWNRSYDDYCALEPNIPGALFAFDGMELVV